MTNKITIELDQTSIDEILGLIKEALESQERMLESLEEIRFEFKKFIELVEREVE